MHHSQHHVLLLQKPGQLTLVYDLTGTVSSSKLTALEYLKHLCLYRAATFEGRQAALKQLTDFRQKLPVYIGNGVLYFPLYGLKSPENYWLCFNYIAKIEAKENGVIVYFTSNFSHYFLIDRRVIQKQMVRCQQYLDRLKELAIFS